MTTQKKNTTMPGMAYPATSLVLATAVSYPPARHYSGWSTAFLACHAARMSSGGASGSTPSTSYHVIPLIIGHR